MVTCGILPEEKHEPMASSFTDFMDEVVNIDSFAFKNFTHDQGVDKFLYMYMAPLDKFLELWEIIKTLLILSHGQASVEQGFSENKECAVDNQSHKSLIARRAVLDAIRAAGGVQKITITPEMRQYVKSAKAKYEQELREKPSDPEKAKRKREEEKEAIMKEKQKLEEELKAMEKNLEGYAEDAWWLMSYN